MNFKSLAFIDPTVFFTIGIYFSVTLGYGFIYSHVYVRNFVYVKCDKYFRFVSLYLKSVKFILNKIRDSPIKERTLGSAFFFLFLVGGGEGVGTTGAGVVPNACFSNLSVVNSVGCGGFNGGTTSSRPCSISSSVGGFLSTFFAEELLINLYNYIRALMSSLAISIHLDIL